MKQYKTKKDKPYALATYDLEWVTEKCSDIESEQICYAWGIYNE